MRERYCLVIFLFFLLPFTVRAGDFVRTEDGIIVRPDAPFSGGVKEIRLTAFSDNIIRVTGIVDEHLQPMESLMITGQKTKVEFDVVSSDTSVSLILPKLNAVADLRTGRVVFTDKDGKRILGEKQSGRQLRPAFFDGAALSNVKQDFKTSADDAWYGLGQHQDGLMNYKTYQVQLFQNNTEVAVPFLISKNNYGILWDNYSITHFGDIRPYLPISGLRLTSKDGGAGWLTATYYNDKNDLSEVAVERPESDIHFEFLGDSKLFLPKEFKPETGMATWEGTISSDAAGVHKLRFTSGGYLKVWINGEVVLDRWRQAWNPASAILNLHISGEKEYALKIEWIPAGGESYLSLKYLPPLPKGEENGFSFSSEAGQQLDYYFICGANMDDVIAGYRKLTGKAVMLPEWAFGFWQSRERYKTQEEVLSTIAEFRKRKIPIDNIVQDWFYWKEDQWGSQEFDPERFPSPDKMIQDLHTKYNAHFMISVWPKFYEGIPAYNEMNRHGWLYTRNIADSVRDWVGKGYHSTFYDVFNPDARRAFWNLLDKKLYTKKIDAWWMDASEPDILSNVTPQRRKEQMEPIHALSSALVLNAYPLLNAKGIYEGQRQANPDNRVFILTRSAYAGSQSYAAATWSGDIGSRWHDMKAQIAAGVNFSMSGIPYWTMDIGGFAVEPRYEKPNDKDLDEWRELNTRWYQFGAFVPLFRAHGQYPYREIYNIAPENHPAYQSMLYYDKLRYRLLPYIYSLAGEVYHRDGTMMRGLVMDFPDDTTAIHLNDEYLFGKALLINPVCNYGQRTREVYLPAGAGWYDFYSGRYYDGGKKMNADAPYQRMPVFVRAGSIVPLGPDLQYVSEKKADVITLYVYGGANGSFDLYEDEGVNYNYEKGRFALIPIKYDDANGVLAIGKRGGTFDGMLKNRTFKIIWVDKTTPAGMDTGAATSRVVHYKGNPVTIKK